MRMFMACLGTETNSFSPIPTGMPAFAATMLRHGDGTASGQHVIVEPLRVWRRLATDAGWQVVESLSAFAEPGGPTAQTAYEELRDEILADLELALPVDVVLLSLHGAMAADGCPDTEGDLLARVRERVGPRAVIGVELDLHCQLTPAMVDPATVVVTYKEYPHVDIVLRAHEVFQLCHAAIEGSTRPVTAVAECGINAYLPTTSEPMRGFVDRMSALEGQDGTLSVSLAHGFPHGDVPGLGARTVVITDGDAGAAAALAGELAAQLWDLRETLRPDYLEIEEAINQALSGPGPVVVADTSDNAGCGAPSDATFFVRALLERGVGSAISAMYWDPVAVQLCCDAGEGATLDLRLGGKCGPASGDPLDLRVRVVKIVHGAQQTFNSFPVPVGDLVWLKADGIDILVNTRRFQVGHPDLMTRLGLDPCQRQIVVVKSTQHFYAGFQPIAARILYAAGPGASNPDTAKLTYRNVEQPFWPAHPGPFS